MTGLLLKDVVVAHPGGPFRGDILAEGASIVAVGRELAAPGAAVVVGAGLTAGPGFIDVHVHGGGGFSFFRKDPTQVEGYAAWAPRNGVTSFLVSTIGRDAPETSEVFTALRPAIGSAFGAEPLGFHLEGPFINPERKGAFAPAMLRLPDRLEFLGHQEAAGGLIRQVTLAPELPGALELIAAVSESGAIPAMGHTDATVAEARRGFEHGVRHVTHLYNAMRPVHQREGGPSVAALLQESVTCELICDGAHVDPDVARVAFRVLGPNRTVVVTDNLEIAGTQQMGGRFAGQQISVAGAKAVREDGTIVGSVATMDEHFRNAMSFFGLDAATAFRMCSTNPARIAGEAHRKGALEPGMDADIVLLDADLQVAVTVCRGQVAYCRDPERIA